MQSSATAVECQHDGKSPEQSHEQRGVELIQPRRGPLGRHGSNTPQHQTHPGNTAAFVQELKRAAVAEQNTATVLRRTER